MTKTQNTDREHLLTPRQRPMQKTHKTKHHEPPPPHPPGPRRDSRPTHTTGPNARSRSPQTPNPPTLRKSRGIATRSSAGRASARHTTRRRTRDDPPPRHHSCPLYKSHGESTLTALSPPIHLGKQSERLSGPRSPHPRHTRKRPFRHQAPQALQRIRNIRQQGRQAHRGEHPRTTAPADQTTPARRPRSSREADGSGRNESLRLPHRAPDTASPRART